MKKYKLTLVLFALIFTLFRYDYISFFLLKNITSINALYIFSDLNTNINTQTILYLYNKIKSPEIKGKLKPYIERSLVLAEYKHYESINNNNDITFFLFSHLFYNQDSLRDDILDQIIDTISLKNNSYYSDVHSNNVFLNQTTCEKFQLLAIYISETQLLLDKQVPILLVWKKITSNEGENIKIPIVKNWSFIEYKDVIFQIGHQKNILFDGGFERTFIPRSGLTATLPFLVYDDQTEQQFNLIYDPPYVVENVILHTTSNSHSAVGLSSSENPNTLLNQKVLITGRYRSSYNADPRIGVSWYNENLNETFARYIIDKPSLEWTKYAGLISIPNEAKTFQYWVLNVEPNTKLDIDNIGMFAVPSLCSE